jgi:PadR family transcriptional regulator, regulatory protein PadR
MPEPLRLSQPGLRVLRAFLQAFSDDVRAELAGADVMKAARIASGTLYPILLRLERAGVLTSRWESESPQILGRPRRRFYQLTASGAKVAQDALSDLSLPLATLAPSES